MPAPKKQPFIIEVRVKSGAQLFNSFDPSPFPERDMDPKAEEFITGWAREAPRGRPFEIHIHLADPEGEENGAKTLSEGIKNFYFYLEERAKHRFRVLMAQGRISLIIGLVFLSFCLWAAKALAGYSQEAMYGIIGEGLIIAGWVAMWRPMQIFLYEWWPLGRERKIYNRLARAKIKVIRARKKG